MSTRFSAPPGTGLLKGLWVTLKTLFSRPATINYPIEKEVPVPRARGVIALDIEACTVCMLCARECPDWCIYIEGHKEMQPPAKEGGRPRSRATLDRFDIDYALCMSDGTAVAGVCHARGINKALPPVWLICLPVGDLGESLGRVHEGGGEVVEARKGTSGEYAYAVIRDPVGACLALVPS